jgi:cyclohexa-1,5-dienecarbonyl-CoA hydratase
MIPSGTIERVGDSVRYEPYQDGQLWRVFLDRPQGNVLDSEMMDGLAEVFRRAAEQKQLKLVTIEGEGQHFSFGASIQEHMPEKCSDMLSRLLAMFEAFHNSQVMVHSIVRGQCLGGGLELAAFCHRIWCHPGASLGQPEIALGVFAPVATVILADRVGRGNAEDLCLSGRIIDATEALGMGLVDEVDEDPWGACTTYFTEHVRPHSASSLRLAVRAMRFHFARRFKLQIEDIKDIYVNELMETHDSTEGLRAFLEKRKPEWKDE